MDKKNQPLIVELEQTHHCISIEVCDKLKDLRIKWLATVGQDEKVVTNLFEIPTDDARKILQTISNHKEVLEARLVQKTNNGIQVIVRQKRDTATAPYLAKAGVAWIHPVWSQEGIDRVTMIAPNFKNLKTFMELVGEKGYDLRIKSKRYLNEKENLSFDLFRSSGFSKLRSASELLTERQMEVFDLACRYGYYETPKRISIADLAQKLDIGESSYAELLRKSEKKLIPILGDILRIMR